MVDHGLGLALEEADAFAPLSGIHVLPHLIDQIVVRIDGVRRPFRRSGGELLMQLAGKRVIHLRGNHSGFDTSRKALESIRIVRKTLV